MTLDTASRANLDAVTNVMLDAFKEATGVDVPPTYVPAVLDMARAAIDKIQPETRAWVALAAVQDLIPSEDPELIEAGYPIDAADVLDALATKPSSSEPTGGYTTVQMSDNAPGGHHVIHLGTDLLRGTGDNVCGMSRHGCSTLGERLGFSVGGGSSNPDAEACLGCVAVASRKPGPVRGMFAHLFEEPA